MTPETWQRIKTIFAAARETPPGERSRFLDTACGGDGELRAEVDSLLAAADTGAGDPLDSPGTHSLSQLRTALADRYQIERELGHGGMATVYLARDLKHDRLVALKVLRSQLARALGAERFEREIKLAARLQHPHILSVHDSGESAGLLWYTMPYVDGETLRQRLERDGRLPVAEALRVAVETARALDYAHAHGVIHRDIKPENLLLTRDGSTLVADFGIARVVGEGAERLTLTGVAIGTPDYMSPEQASGRARLDARTDVYSLGCVVYEMLAGETPFAGQTIQEVLAQHIHAPLPSFRVLNTKVSGRLRRVLETALAKAPANRFHSAGEFARALELSVSNQRLFARAMFGLSGPGLRRPVMWLAALAVLGAGTWLAVKVSKASPPSPRVVVGTFENRTADRRDGYVGVMTSDWITQGLQRAGFIEVVPTTTALAASQYLRREGSPDPVRGLARETGATLVITGSVYRFGDSLEIQAQLTDATTGRLIGVSEPVRTQASSPSEGLSRLQARLMGLLAIRLDERLGPVAAGAAQPPTFAAYQAFSEGLDAYVRTEYKSALASFQRAHELDSAFVNPLLYAAICYINLKNDFRADSLLSLVAKRRDELSQYDRYWLEYSQAEMRGNRLAAVAALRKAALLAPGSKAVYNFAEQALEAGLPFAAESALARLSPDLGPMRDWLPYWEVLTDALHMQGKYESEQVAAHSARLRFPADPDAYLLELRALAALHRPHDISALLSETERTSQFTPVQMGNLAFEAANELRAHGDSVSALPFLIQADGWFMRDSGQDPIAARWGRMQVAAHRGYWLEAAALGKVLVKEDSSSVSYRGMLGVVLAKGGDQRGADSILVRLANDSQPYTFGIPQYEGARVAAALGRTEEAVHLVVLSHSRGFPLFTEPHRDIALGALRQHPLLNPVFEH